MTISYLAPSSVPVQATLSQLVNATLLSVLRCGGVGVLPELHAASTSARPAAPASSRARPREQDRTREADVMRGSVADTALAMPGYRAGRDAVTQSQAARGEVRCTTAARPTAGPPAWP